MARCPRTLSPRPEPARRRVGRALLLSALAVLGAAAQSQPRLGDTLAVAFDGRRGQVEVGGAYAGVEFHDSRPVPARLSFYSPVANSIDLSTDYWRRGESRPLALTVRVGDRTDTLGTAPWAYHWTPYSVVFQERAVGYDAALEYRFADDLPVVVMRLTVWNRTGRRAAFEVGSWLATSLRTSHTYATREPARTGYVDDGAAFVASFDAADTDSVALFVVNVGAAPDVERRPSGPRAAFTYTRELGPGDSLVVTQLIGTTRRGESADVRRRAVREWAGQVEAYEDGIRTYVRDQGRFDLADPELRETDRLARALLRADRHYLDGHVVPMPSPAEYNFFFTHDLLLTDLGAVFFDPARVREDLLYVQSLVRADSVLPHARYWKDGAYVTEPANADNWNHLWAVLLAASYLKHSGDTATVAALYPTLQKSTALMLGNERDGLMYAERPDWWDIGHVYGPRAYLTALTIRALDTFRRIVVDGADSPSAVLTGPASRIELERGAPEAPYLAAASGLVERVTRSADGRSLAVGVRGVVGQRVVLDVVGPSPFGTVHVDGTAVPTGAVTAGRSGAASTLRLIWTLEAPVTVATFGP